ncbi:MAG: phosphate ABC transporter permease PstA [Anaerolineae bacterium]|nr:phosphate ABC transporter permease PstA [Anaerolineae bacterium]
MNNAIDNNIFANPGNLPKRHQIGKIWSTIFFASTTIGIVALTVLLLSIINQAMGLVIIENKIDPMTLAERPLEELPKEELISILQANLSKNRIKTIEKEKPLDARSQIDIYGLVMERVVQPTVVKSYTLTQSLLSRSQIEREAVEKYPNAKIEFRSWINFTFLKKTMSSKPELAGVSTALMGSLYLIAITIAVAFPIGVGAAIYLEEYANKDNRINKIIQTNIDNLAGVPSIVYGILGLAIFVRTLETITSGAAFGIEGNNGRSILSAGLTMALLILPILIINAQEAIRAVPDSLRQAAFGLGATKWQTVWYHVLPNALPGILTGTILAISRAIGETAPLILVGASTYITTNPSSPFSKFTALPIQIYNWTTRPQDTFRNIAAAAIIVLLISLLSLNAVAILMRNRFSRQRL